jgi:phosphoglycerate dehydrogenase-like enzyme
MRIVSRSHVLTEPLGALAARRGIEFVAVGDAASLHRELADADALWLWPAFYDAALVDELERCAPRLGWLQLMTMGYDPVELHGAPLGVTITNAGDSYGPTVAEHAVTLLLALLRQLPHMLRQAEARTWDQSVTAQIRTLNDATVAVIGFGNIGREIAIRLRALGARVVAVTRSGEAGPLADEAARVDDLHAILGRCDAAILAVPLTPSTRHLIDAAALAAMPQHALLVNIARGGVIDSAALADALAAGRIAGAGLDVTDPEPLPPESLLWSLPNAIVTPHVAGFGGQVPGRRVLALIERNLDHYRARRPLEACIPVAPRHGRGVPDHTTGSGTVNLA